MELFNLSDFISDLGIDPTDEDLQQLFGQFKKDFVDGDFFVKGLKVKVILKNSTISGYEKFPETFVHLITRKSKGGKRVFDKYRANKIHWIRLILENHNSEDIRFFQYLEGNGKTRDYYWLKNEDFLVVMEQVTSEYLIITCFHIDDERNRKYFEDRYRYYCNSLKK